MGRLRWLIARFEETRELRLMGGYAPGVDAVLDQAVKTVPRIYEAMRQSPSSPPCAESARRSLGAKPMPTSTTSIATAK